MLCHHCMPVLIVDVSPLEYDTLDLEYLLKK